MSDLEHLILAKEELPMPDTAEGILSVLRGVLNKPYIQSVLLSQGNPIQVTWYRDITDSLQTTEPEESIDSVLGRIDLNELSGPFNAKEIIIEGMMRATINGEYPTHLLVGNIESFRDLMGIPSMVPIPQMEGSEYLNFIGMPLIEVPGIHRDAIVLLTAGVRDADLFEVKNGYKLSL